MGKMNTSAGQAGFVLVTAMVFLVALTLIGASMVSLGSSNLRVVSNMQAQIEARSVAQQVIEGIVSSNFAKSAATLEAVRQDYNVVLAAGYKDYTVSVDDRPCMQQFKKFSVSPKDPRTALDDYKSCVQGADSYCADTVWRIAANVSEGWFGANETVVQGVSLVVDVESGTFHDADKYDTDRTSADPENPYCH